MPFKDTPKNIIEEFDKKFLFASCDDCDENIKIRQEHKCFLISKMITEYEEMLEEVERMNKSDKGIMEIQFEDGTLAKREIDSDMVIGYNKAISDIILLIQSKLKAWRELRD